MYKEFYSGMDWAALPVVALLFFLVAFALILLRTFAARRSRDFDAMAALPFGDGEPAGALSNTREVKP